MTVSIQKGHSLTRIETVKYLYSKTPIYRRLWEHGKCGGKSGAAVNRGFQFLEAHKYNSSKLAWKYCSNTHLCFYQASHYCSMWLGRELSHFADISIHKISWIHVVRFTFCSKICHHSKITCPRFNTNVQLHALLLKSYRAIMAHYRVTCPILLYTGAINTQSTFQE